MKDKTCTSCGMPIRSSDEVAAGNVDSEYCHHCSNDDGTLKSYEEVLGGMTQFMVRTQGIDETVASNLAKEMMKKLPAWSNG